MLFLSNITLHYFNMENLAIFSHHLYIQTLEQLKLQYSQQIVYVEW